MGGPKRIHGKGGGKGERKAGLPDIMEPERIGKLIEHYSSDLESPKTDTRIMAVRHLTRLCLEADEAGSAGYRRILNLLADKSLNSGYSDVKLRCIAALTVCSYKIPFANPPSNPSDALSEEGPGLLDGLYSTDKNERKAALKRLGEICMAYSSEGARPPPSLLLLFSHLAGNSEHKDVQRGSLDLLYFCGARDHILKISFREFDNELETRRAEALRLLSENGKKP